MNTKSNSIKILAMFFATFTLLKSQKISLKDLPCLYGQRVRYENADHDHIEIDLSWLSDNFSESSKNTRGHQIVDIEDIDLCQVIIDDAEKSVAITNIPHLILKIKGNDITHLPASIGNLTNLEVLDISYNHIEQLPASIGNLRNLTSLNVQTSWIRELPQEIGNLKKLEMLNASRNRFASLPETIGELGNLRSLYINNTGLTILPASIGNLVNLEVLDASGNYFKELPTDIGMLKNLIKLYVNRTGFMMSPQYKHLQKIPESIGDLINLEVLDLCYNDLEQLPESIGFLANLQELHVNGNRLKELPDSIDNLPSIKIFARNNSFERLPQLPASASIDIEDNISQFLNY